MYCGYHNHTHEFTKVDNTTYWHLFAQRTSKTWCCSRTAGGRRWRVTTRLT